MRVRAAVVTRSPCPTSSPMRAHGIPPRWSSETRRCRRSCGEKAGTPAAVHARPIAVRKRSESNPWNTRRSGVRSSRATSAVTAAKRTGGTSIHRPGSTTTGQALNSVDGAALEAELGEVGTRQHGLWVHQAGRSSRASAHVAPQVQRPGQSGRSTRANTWPQRVASRPSSGAGGEGEGSGPGSTGVFPAAARLDQSKPIEGRRRPLSKTE